MPGVKFPVALLLALAADLHGLAQGLGEGLPQRVASYGLAPDVAALRQHHIEPVTDE